MKWQIKLQRRQQQEKPWICLNPDLCSVLVLAQRWRAFCNQFEGIVEDFNYGTLLRLDCEKDYSEENTIFATRVQFFAVEIARNREGCNDTVFLSKENQWLRKLIDCSAIPHTKHACSDSGKEKPFSVSGHLLRSTRVQGDRSRRRKRSIDTKGNCQPATGGAVQAEELRASSHVRG
uniref:Polysaccharide biosynthesis domain-containing protein n=1 Tax=Cyprinodon variegatus TaxID=28743 RepID=A0A3Q2DSK2_CYPVA